MQSRPTPNKNNIKGVKNTRKWRDIGQREKKIWFIESLGFTIALLILSAQFWRYFSLSVFGTEIDTQSQELVILRTSIMTLGIIVIAVQFNAAISIFLRNIGVFPIVTLAFISVVWSINAPQTLQHSLLLLLLIIFATAIAIRYEPSKSSSLMAICTILIVGFEFLNVSGNRYLILSDYKIPGVATALVFSVWAAIENNKWRSVYILAAFILLVVGIITKSTGLEITIVGLICGGLLFVALKFVPDSPLRMSLVVVILMCYFAYMLTRFGMSAANALDEVFSQSNNSLQGFGFGTNGSSIFAKFVTGLGLLGIMAIALYILIGIIIGVFAVSEPKAALSAFFGLLGILIFRPKEIDFISVEIIGFLVAYNILLRGFGTQRIRRPNNPPKARTRRTNFHG